MNRRDFLKTSATAAAGLTTFGPDWARVFSLTRSPYLEQFADLKKRVGLIGSGWYGKCDLLRLIQVAPVEVVSLCDVDSTMLSNAADLVATRQASKQRPRTYKDYREMLKEKDLDIVIVGTPDHWHALPTIAAIEAGADIYVQKPISIDVTEGQAMLAAARTHKKVVQVGTQRRSTPHLAQARDKYIRTGQLGKIAYVEIYCYYHMRTRENPPDIAPPPHLDWEFYQGPAPARAFNKLIHPRGWRAFMEYSNGIVGDMCIHMLDMVRWMMDLGMPARISSSGGILVDKGSKANTTDTQTATFDYGDLQVVWTHRAWGDPPDPKYPWGATFYGEKGTLKASVMSYDFIPRGEGQPEHVDVKYELEEFPEDKTEKDLERHVAPAIRAHMKDLLTNIQSRGTPVADIEQGYISTTACILANLSDKLNRSITWDHAAGKVVGDDEANRLLTRPYRAPWRHPGVRA
jgi:predicted dehydrogenase